MLIPQLSPELSGPLELCNPEWPAYLETLLAIKPFGTWKALLKVLGPLENVVLASTSHSLFKTTTSLVARRCGMLSLVACP